MIAQRFHVEHSRKYTAQQAVITVKDHFKSGESFELVPDPEHGFLVTVPAPPEDRLPYYYDSEEYISHTDSNKGLMSRIYQMVKGISLKRKFRLIRKHRAKTGSLLDVGAGTGDFLKYMSKQGWKVSGSEPNDAARQLALIKGIELKSALESFSGQRFDVISLWHVLEHIPNLKQALKQLDDLLEDDGKLIIAVPNFRSWDAQHYGPFWAAYDVPRHLWHFDEDSLTSLLGERFELLEVAPMKFDSYYVSLLSEKYKGGSLGMFKAVLNGWRSNRRARKSGAYSSLIYVFTRKQG